MFKTKTFVALLMLCCSFACKTNTNTPKEQQSITKAIQTNMEFGFNLDNFIVKKDTIKSGESFGEILSSNNLGYSKIFEIAETIKDTFDISRLRAGKAYTLLFDKANDSLKQPTSFIYQQNKEDYVVVNFKDSIEVIRDKKPVIFKEKTLTGIINSNISQTLEEKGISQVLAHKLADDIYAWTIDFRRLQKGDRFKVVYTNKYIDDTIYAGIHNVKAAYFEHKGDSLYAFEFQTDSVRKINDYFNEDAKNLRRAFLKAPVKFSRISSRYNLKRRIAYYGYKIRPHKGTDFAAAVGTPIMATANGTVTESTRRGGNGKFVKIRHNDTYSTQYLHMSKRAVNKGDFVKQGDIIGYVGMTGNTGGPHVCYRFWKNGKQVDPFQQKLPEAKPIDSTLKVKYLKFIQPLKQQLDNMLFLEADTKETFPTLTEKKSEIQ